MAKFDRFMIAPINTGLETDMQPWLIPDDAFDQLVNAYVFRGRVVKRFGSALMNGSVAPEVAQQYSRLRVQVGTIAAPVSPVPGTKFNVGQMFSAGDQMFTVFQLGIPAAMLATGPGTGTFNTTTGAFTLAGTGLAGATPIYWYPADPVMGLISFETPIINDEPVFGFDTQFAYTFNGTAWLRLGTAVWTGTDQQFFWGYNYRGLTNADTFLFVTNFNPPDLIKYWDGTAWNNLNPVFNAAGDTIRTTRIVVPFKDRLVFLNTVESIGAVDTSFVNRARFSQNGSPLTVDAWREDIPGKGGYIEASTKEAIITAEFLKDRLIVYFERSTWELVYTGNEILPFRWQQINTELGAESTFSVVPFDKVVLGIGNVGVHACNGANVERIDQKIPDTVFEISNDNGGIFRVYGIRDYFAEMVYWTFPAEDQTNDDVFPNRVLVFNYKTGSWAFNEDSITVFGYYQPNDDYTWNSTNYTWEEADFPWSGASLQSKFRFVLAGNQQGFVFIVDIELARNAPALQITNVTVLANIVTITSINHNLVPGEFIVIESVQGMTNINNLIFKVYTTTLNSFTINVPVNTPAGVYLGGGTIGRISNIGILTKQYNFYVDQGRNAYIAMVDFLVDKTDRGQVTIDSFVSTAENSLLQESTVNGSILGSNILETSPYALVNLEQSQDRVWHAVYLQAEGECVQLRIYMSDAQMMDPDITWSDFQLHGMTFYTTPTASRLQ